MTTIGIIDDDEDSNLMLSTLLEGPYKVMAFQNAQEALKAFELQQPNLILLDISMPGADGYTVLKQILENPMLSYIPVIALTAYVLPGDRGKFTKQGFKGAITKPILDNSSLFQMINQFVK